MADRELWIGAEDSRLHYMGRIDDADPANPVWVYPCTSVRIRFRGSGIRARITNLHSYYENSVGVILDGVQSKHILTDGPQELVLARGLGEAEHELLLFKRMDACHYLIFQGFTIEGEAEILELPPEPRRRMEVYGDSVSAGEVSEAVKYCGLSDPENHNGVYSNSWYSYSWLTARSLGAQLYNEAQGGLALLDGTGYYCGPDFIGLESTYDKIQANPYIMEAKPWDFGRYRPHVVVVAIGQNDSHPDDYMSLGYDHPKAQHWRSRYMAFIRCLRRWYPKATIILSTTILNHDSRWDESIEEVCSTLADPRIHHFLYSANGCGTPGHIRIPEAEQMALELAGFIESLGEDIWEDED